MKVLITGASGFIGTSLANHLIVRGSTVVALKRDYEESDLEGFDIVIHLAAEPLPINFWSHEKKRKIFESRKFGTQRLSHALAHVKHPPKLFLSASAIGFYGDRKEELLDENSNGGKGFLADVCKEWERASFAIESRGVRVVHARFGMVLGKDGGALKKMIPLYRLGLGAVLGSGNQWISWIAKEDLIKALEHIIKTPSLNGAINLVSPEPVRQKDFANTLAQLLNCHLFLKIPAWLLKCLGIVADELLLSSTKVYPTKLLASNFNFDYPHLQRALQRAILNELKENSIC